MSVPQDSKTRRAQKKKRTKQLAKWREKQADKASTAQPAKAAAKKKS